MIVTTIFDQITAALARGERVELRGFGAFTMRRRGARIGHNPRAREVVAVKEKTAQLNAEPWLVFRKYFAGCVSAQPMGACGIVPNDKRSRHSSGLATI